MTNCIEFLEKNILINPEKIALVDQDVSLKYIDVYNISNNFVSNIAYSYRGKPIVVVMKKSAWAVCAFMGILKSGNFYVPLDCDMPFQRIALILREINPKYVIVDSTTKKLFDTNLKYNYLIINFEEVYSKEDCLVPSIRIAKNDLEPVYVIYTSGSTGNPKGVVVSHRGVIDYINWAIKKFNFNGDTVFGNQAPFHFDNSIFDIYCTFASGGTMVIIPKLFFAFPKNLIEYMNEMKINTIFWVPSAINSLNCIEENKYARLNFIQRIMFCGEVMHNKLLNNIRRIYPNVLYANLYGPTEITDACTYYIVERDFLDDEPLPIGIPCENTKVFLINNGKSVEVENSIGEICVGGTGVALGYYKNKELSDKVFTQNPLNNQYYERIYHTGDLGKFCDGNLYFVGRLDEQIKRNGYRIELGEIDSVMILFPNIKEVATVYDSKSNKILLFYSGECKESELRKWALGRLPIYMNPDIYIRKHVLPRKENMKIDKKGLLNSETKKCL